MKHKHYELIKAWADDTTLAVLFKGVQSESFKCFNTTPAWFDDFQYYLCHEKHIETCLHWLNGGEATFDGWVCIDKDLIEDYFRDEDTIITIKPKTEMVDMWVGTLKLYHADHGSITRVATLMKDPSEDPVAPEGYIWTKVQVEQECE